MTKPEAEQAAKMLEDRLHRYAISGADVSGGFCLTVEWIDGGEKLFYTLREVEAWIADKELAEQ